LATSLRPEQTNTQNTETLCQRTYKEQTISNVFDENTNRVGGGSIALKIKLFPS